MPKKQQKKKKPTAKKKASAETAKPTLEEIRGYKKDVFLYIAMSYIKNEHLIHNSIFLLRRIGKLGIL